MKRSNCQPRKKRGKHTQALIRRVRLMILHCVESGCHIPTRKMDAKGIDLKFALALGWNPPTIVPRTAEVDFVGMEKLGGSNRRHSRRFGKSRPPTTTPQIEKSWLNLNCGCVGNKTIKLFHSPSERPLGCVGQRLVCHRSRAQQKGKVRRYMQHWGYTKTVLRTWHIVSERGLVDFPALHGIQRRSV